MEKKVDCNMYDEGQIPPCSNFLGNVEPIIIDGKVVFRNENKVFYFISTLTNSGEGEEAQTPPVVNPIINPPVVSTNLQISMATFFVGLFINKIQQEQIKNLDSIQIHSDKTADEFIHKTLKKCPNVITDYTAQLSFIITSLNAILPLYTYTLTISPLNYYILFILSRLERNPALFFGNNAYVSEDCINFTLAAMSLQFPKGPFDGCR